MAVEEDGTRESISVFAFFEANLDTPAEFGIFQPLQHEKGSFYSPELAQRRVEAVLAGVLPDAEGAQSIVKLQLGYVLSASFVALCIACPRTWRNPELPCQEGKKF